MKFKPVRSLAVLMAVLMIFMALPAVPASAESTVTSIIIKLGDGLSNVTLYDGSITAAEASKQPGHNISLWKNGAQQEISQGKITIDSNEYSVEKSGEGFAVKLSSGGAFNSDIPFGFAVNAEKFVYTAAGKEEESLAGTGENIARVGETILYAGTVTASFAVFFDESGKWAAEFVGSTEVTLTISVPTPTYSVTYTDITEWSLYTEKECTSKKISGTVTVEANKDFDFYIKPTNSNKKPTIEAYVNSVHTDVETPVAEGLGKGIYAYRIAAKNVTGDIRLIVGLVDITYSVYVSSESSKEGFVITGLDRTDPTSVTSGSSVNFTVRPAVGYPTPAVTLSKGGTESPETAKGGAVLKNNGEGSYTISNIVNDVEVKITVDGKIQLPVHFDKKGTGYTMTVKKDDDTSAEISNGESVAYGTKLTVEVEVDEAYSNSKGSALLNVNGTPTRKTDGCGNKFTYQVEVKGETYLTVSGLSINKYTVNMPGGSGKYSVSGFNTGSYEHGSSISFEVTIGAPYKLADSCNIQDTVKGLFTNGEDLASKVTINLIEGDPTKISVSGTITSDLNFSIYESKIVDKTFTVTAAQSDGYTVKITYPEDAQQNVKYGGSVTFTVAPSESYNIVRVSYTMVGGTSGILEAYEGVYTISNIIGNVTITVTTSQSFDVKLPISSTGYTVTYTGEQTQNITKDGKVTFTVSLEDGYKLADGKEFAAGDNCIIQGVDKDNLSVSVAQNRKSAIYTVTVTGELTITVVAGAVEAVKLTVSAPDTADGFKFAFVGTTGSDIGYNNSVSFTVAAKPGYRVTSVTFTPDQGDVQPLTSNSTTYNIFNIKSSGKIIVAYEVVKVTVNYNLLDCKMYGVTFPVGTASKQVTYDVVTNSDGRFEITDSSWALKLEVIEVEGFKHKAFKQGDRTIQSITLPLDGANPTYEVDCEYYLDVYGSDKIQGDTSHINNALGVKATEKKLENEGNKVAVSGVFNGTQSVLQALQGQEVEFEFVSVGMLYCQTTLANLDSDELAEAVKKLSGKGFLQGINGHEADTANGIYSFYYDAESFLIGDTYTQKVTRRSGQGRQERYASMWFKVSINDTEYVFFGEVQHLTYQGE